MPAATLTPDERKFIDGPVAQLCAMLDEWDISWNRRDLPPEVWAFLKAQRFFGMIIPRRYGGLGFRLTRIPRWCAASPPTRSPPASP